MSIRDEIIPFIDGNGLVAPARITPGILAASSNGAMYTAEYFAILKKSGQLTAQDKLDFAKRIGQCIDSNGLLNRAPLGQDSNLDSPDDYIGTINGAFQVGNTSIPRGYLVAVAKYFGALNNTSPGTWTPKSFLVRQVQILTAMVTAAFPSWKNPLHILVRVLCAPLYWFSALSILWSCQPRPTSDTDYRRLAWHHISIVKNHSLVCKLASLLWLKLLHFDYKTDNGMRAVAGLYYEDGHPFSQYWID